MIPPSTPTKRKQGTDGESSGAVSSTNGEVHKRSRIGFNPELSDALDSEESDDPDVKIRFFLY